VLLAGGVLLASLIIDVTWPTRWLAMLGPYERVIPVLELPFGPLLLLAAVRWQERRARVLLLMAVLPMRGLYDICLLWLLPRTRQQTAQLTLASWLMYPLMVIDADITLFVILVLYLPALLMIIWPWMSRKWFDSLRR